MNLKKGLWSVISCTLAIILLALPAGTVSAAAEADAETERQIIRVAFPTQ
ncbi:MAG: hypothetical protein SOT68_03550 [Oscillospiraceae bacterium]|nr:hypothetical protein [Oscillospiraceae bacterium]MDD7278452.1 hypothetical protein [Oscillospiraceae bacterium]MDY2863254.1 hypothetical protein [Oscillospiraceae bacterium]